MARYFMGDTRLESLERMMMDSSRRSPVPPRTRQKRHYREPAHRHPVESAVSKRKTKEDGV